MKKSPYPVVGRLKFGCNFPMCNTKYYCHTGDPKYRNKRFHRFPKDLEMRKKWLDICGISHESYRNSLKICQDHFVTTDFLNRSKTILRSGVYPKFLNPRLQIEENQTSGDFLRDDSNLRCDVNRNCDGNTRCDANEAIVIDPEESVALCGKLANAESSSNLKVNKLHTFATHNVVDTEGDVAYCGELGVSTDNSNSQGNTFATDSSDSDNSVHSEDFYEPSYSYMTTATVQKFGDFSEDEWQNEPISRKYDKFVTRNINQKLNITLSSIDEVLTELNFLLEDKYVRGEHDEITEAEQINRLTIQKLGRLSSLLKNRAEHLEILLKLMRLGKFAVLKANLEIVSDAKMSNFLPKLQKVCTKRWSLNEKVLALSLYKQSPLLYKYLYCFFHLPPKRSFDIILAKMPYNLGLNDNVLELLLTRRSKMQKKDSCCALLFEQITLEDSKLYYEHHNELLGRGEIRPSGTYATIISLQGIARKWRMIIAYYFTSSFKDYKKINSLIHCIIDQLQRIKYDVCALILNKNKINTPIINRLQGSDFLSVKTPYFKVNDKTVYIIYNFPGLVYEFWKMFEDHNIEGPQSKVAKFEEIVKALAIDNKSRFGIGKTLIENKRKMTPHRFAVQQMGYKMASLIENGVIRGLLQPEAMYTAELLCMMHRISNSMSGVNLESSCEDRYNCVLSNESQHSKLWNEAVQKMSTWSVKQLSGRDRTKYFCVDHTWRQLFSGIIELWNELQKKGFRFLPVKNLTLDSLDHFVLGFWEYNEEPF